MNQDLQNDEDQDEQTGDSDDDDEKQKDGPFLSMIKENTKKLVGDGTKKSRLDEIGIEPPGLAIGALDSLDLQGIKEKHKVDR